MKYVLFILPVVLFGCAAVPPDVIAEPNCLKSDWEIQQVLDDGFLLRECEYRPYVGRTCYGLSAFFKVDTSKQPWDSLAEGMVLSSKGEGSCLVKDGTYKYVTTMGVERTILKLNGAKDTIPNPEYIKWKESQKQPKD